MMFALIYFLVFILKLKSKVLKFEIKTYTKYNSLGTQSGKKTALKTWISDKQMFIVLRIHIFTSNPISSTLQLYHNIIQMSGKKNMFVAKKHYSQISLKKRTMLVDQVIEQGYSLTKVAKKLKIKLSTAKLIVKKFKKTGILFNKRLRNSKKEIKQIKLAINEQITPSLEKKQNISLQLKSKVAQIKHQTEPEYISYPNTNPNPLNLWFNNYLLQQTFWPWSTYYQTV